jgi:signal transduction histidine kinase
MHDGPLPSAAGDPRSLRASEPFSHRLMQMRSRPSSRPAKRDPLDLESMTDDDRRPQRWHRRSQRRGLRAVPEPTRSGSRAPRSPSCSPDLSAAARSAAGIELGLDAGAQLELTAHAPGRTTVPVAVDRLVRFAGERLNTVVLRDIERRRLRQHLRGYARSSAQNAISSAAAEGGAGGGGQDQFNMNHEIRTPMTAILGFTDILLEDEASTPVERRRASDPAQRRLSAGDLNDILDFSKIEANRLRDRRGALRPGGLRRRRRPAPPAREQKRVDLVLELDSPIPRSATLRRSACARSC